MERKIGEIFEYNGEWYQCVVAMQGCRECSFRTRDYCTRHSECMLTERSDKTSVIFKKLEKVGEPMKIHNRLVLKVKADAYKCMRCCFYSKGKCELTMQECEHYDCGEENKFIELKQNKEDMEEKKDNYDGYMDKECIHICDALNSIPDVRTTESCCGHCKDRFMIFLTCDNSHSLAIIARVFDRRYIGTSQPWYIELQTKDSGAYGYFIHSETKYDSEEVMMKDINQIIENIKYWCDDKFASHFKGCDDKPTLAPFDINLAKQGKPVCTRDGRKARILCYDFKQNEEYPILVAVENKDGKECALLYSNDGISEMYKSSNNELAMFLEKKEGWVNVYKKEQNRYVKGIFPSREIALNSISEKSRNKYIATIKITWEE